MRHWIRTHTVFVRALVMALVLLSATLYPKTAAKAQVVGAFEGHWFGIVQCQSGAYGYRDWYLQQSYGRLYGLVYLSTISGDLNGRLATIYTASITESFPNGTVFTYSVTRDRSIGKITGKLVPDSPKYGPCTITMELQGG